MTPTLRQHQPDTGMIALRILSPVVVSFFLVWSSPGQSEETRALAREFFAWRATSQPATSDDMNRVERPDGWKPDWSPASLLAHDAKQREFRNRLEGLPRSRWTIADSLDALLLRSAIARVDYELNVVRSARRNPDFYVQQTLGAVFELILQPPPFDDRRARNIILRLESIPATLRHAKTNLTEAVAAFAGIAVATLDRIEQRLSAFQIEILPLIPASLQKRFTSAVNEAHMPLTEYREWLRQEMTKMKGGFAIGPEAYDRFLKEIALMPYTADDLLRMGRIEWERSVAFDHFESLRNAGLLSARLFATAQAQIEKARKDEEDIRRFLTAKDILDVPAWIGHYRNLKMPEYLRALSFLGVTDDLASPSRRGQDGVSYILDPSPDLSFFRKSTAQDPRPIIVHEGIPGHYFQLNLSWSHPDTIRWHYFDSGPMEGLGFYAEEMMLQHGLFDDRPRTREIVYRFMRLRALRVEVDVRLARGEFSIEDAAGYLERTVPLDRETARQEAAFFASNPGQAISYQIGKMQILKFITDAKLELKDRFNLRALHNYIWINGNVPIALQRWELLGLRDEVERLW